MELLISSALLSSVIGVSIWAAFNDFYRLRIPNVLSIVIVVLFGAFCFVEPLALAVWWKPFVAAAVMLIVTFMMFAGGILGAGDSKLAAALALWAGLSGLPAFLFFMSCYGGILSILGILLRKYKPVSAPFKGGWVDEIQSGRNALPYGIAISGGAITSFFYITTTEKQISFIYQLCF